MKTEILSTLLQAKVITQEWADILSHCAIPESIYGLYSGNALDLIDGTGLISDEELKALVQFENLLAGIIPENENSTSLPLLMVILSSILQFVKNPTGASKSAMNNALATYDYSRKAMKEEIRKVTLEQVDDHINKFKMDIFRKHH